MIRTMARLTNRVSKLARGGRDFALALATQERGADAGLDLVRPCSLARAVAAVAQAFWFCGT